LGLLKAITLKKSQSEMIEEFEKQFIKTGKFPQNSRLSLKAARRKMII